MKKPALSLLLLFIFLANVHGRMWTNRTKQSFEGELVGFDGKSATIIRAVDQKKFTIDINTLSDVDQYYLKAHRLKSETKPKPKPKIKFDSGLLKNGDFSYGTSSWDGETRLAKDDKDKDKEQEADKDKEQEAEADKNKYLIVHADDDEIKKFSQEDIPTGGLTDIILKFNYKVMRDYTGRGITVRFIRPDQTSTYGTLSSLRKDEKWHAYTWNFGEIRGADELTFVVEVLEGEGTIMFDEFTIKPK